MASPVPQEASEALEKKAIRVLYVDDSPFDRGLVRDALTVDEDSFELVEAASQSAFEERLRQGRYDLVLSDFNILGFEGLQVIDAVRATDPRIPVVIVTGTGSEEVAVKAMKRGAADYVIKSPQHIRRLPQTIRAAIERRRLRRQRRRMKKELKKRLEQQHVVAELSQRALSASQIQQLLDAAVEKIAATLKVESCAVWELSEDEKDFLLKSGFGWRPAQVGVARLEADKHTQPGLALHSEKPVSAICLKGEAHLPGFPRLPCRKAVGGLHIAIPGQERPYGVLAVHSTDKKRFHGDEVQFLEAVANVLAEAVEWRRAEACLRQSEQLFREITENAQDVVMILDAQGCFKYISPSAERILGFSKEELKGKPIFEHIHADELDIAQKQFERFLSEPSSEACECRFRCKDGTFRTFESLAKPLLDNPAVAGVVVHSRDITRIREVEAHQLALVEAIPDVILRLDRQANVLEYKPPSGFETTVSLSPGDSLIGLVSEETAREGLMHIQRALETGETQAFEFQMGQEDPVFRESRVVAWGDDQVIAIVRDITERHRAEAALKESEQRYRLLAETAQDLIILHDSQGRITYCNHRCLQVTGYGQDEMMGLRIEDLFPEQIRNVRSLPGQNKAFLYESVLSRSDGQPTAVEVSACPFDTGNGSGGMLLIARDIRDRKRAQRRIQQQASLLDEVQDAILVRNLAGLITHWNRSAERIYQWKSEDVMGRRLGEFVIHESQPSLEAACGEALRQGKWSGKLTQKRKDGSQIVVRSRLKLLRNSQGQPHSVLLVNTDLTEQQRIEDQFLRSQRMENVGALAGGIAHDLNNMLEPILLGAGLLQMLTQDERALTYIATMESSAQRASSLVRQLLAFARGSSGQKTRFEPKHLITEVEQIFFQTIPRTITIKKRICEDLWPITGDITQIHQVLLNLGVNARDAMRHGGLLSLEADNLRLKGNALGPNQPPSAGDYVLLKVSDTGSGIEPDVLEQIFEPFFTTKEAGKGTGLGLSTVQSIVKGHDGYLRVESRVGRGTSFMVYLPAEPGSMQYGSVAVNRSLPRGDGRTVLFIDDEPSILETARATLEAYGFRVLTACDGTHAVSVYIQEADAIDVVVTDLMMPFMDGAATIRALRKINPDIRVIAVTGLNEHDELPGVTCLSKPYSTEELLETLSGTISDKTADPEASRNSSAALYCGPHERRLN